MRKTHAHVKALLGALALTAFGMTGCSHGSGGGGGRGSAGTISLYKGASPQGEFPSIAEALKAVPVSGSDTYIIKLGSGTYNETEQLTYNGSNTIKISGVPKGEWGDGVLIRGVGSDYTKESGRSMFEIRGSGNTILEHITMEHADMMTEVKYTDATGEHKSTQREVIGHQSSGTFAAYNCSFLSGQDTIRTESKAWFYKCYIEGDVDFLWIENAKGVVALYEECELKAIGSRTKTAYFTAPRLGKGSKVGKGLIIYNSKLIVDSALSAAYLGRNPWNEEYYNDFYEQVAVVKSTLEGNLTDTWYTKSSNKTPEANGTPDQAYVGFKTDSYFSSYSNGGRGKILTSDQVSAEYAGRNNILNRVYNVGEECFQQDSSVWDVAALVAANGWNVTGDSSQSKLDGDSAKTSVTYTFTDKDKSNGWTDSLVDTSNFSFDTNGYAQGNTNQTLTFWIVGDCTITVTGYYSGAATVTHGSSSASYTIATTGASDSAVLSLTGISSAGERVTITANEDKTYIKSIDIQYTTNVDAALEALRKKRDEAASMTVTWEFSGSIPARTQGGTTWIKTDGTKSDTAPSASDAAIYIYGDATKEGNSSYIDPAGTLYGSAALYVPVASGSGYKVTVTYHVNDKCYLTIGGTRYDSMASTSVVINCDSATLKTKSDIPALVSGISYLPIELGSTDPGMTGTSMKGYVSKIVVSAE